MSAYGREPIGNDVLAKLWDDMDCGYKMSQPEAETWAKTINGIIEKEVDAVVTNAKNVELAYRKLLWLSHFHPIAQLYGDDGEMQCVNCAKYGVTDYLRQPLAECERAADLAKLERANDVMTTVERVTKENEALRKDIADAINALRVNIIENRP